MSSLRHWSSGIALTLAVPFCASFAEAEQSCLKAPYTDGSGEIAILAEEMIRVLADYPSLAKALEEEAPLLCLDDTLVEEQAYYEPKARRIVVRAGLSPDFQLAVIVHEVRHLEQYTRQICPTIQMLMVDYMRARQALEADAAAIGIFIAWEMRADGNSGPWEALRVWPTHDDLTEVFAAEMAATGDTVKATAATYAAWFTDQERREIYAFVSCSNYLDALDRDKVLPGKVEVEGSFVADLCRMPDGRPYGCFLPP